MRYKLCILVLELRNVWKTKLSSLTSERLIYIKLQLAFKVHNRMYEKGNE